MQARAYAKVNLGLRVGSLRADGFHPLDSIFQSIDWSDRVELAPAEEDGITGWRGGPVPAGEANLAWRAVIAVREAAGADQPVAVRLDKQIAVAAGLGGGSADAAAALHLARRHFGMPVETVTDLAPMLGSDVPFCAAGGTARIAGRGDVYDVMTTLSGFALAIVVPPVELATPRVFRRWDELGEPEGPGVDAADLPPELRPHGPLVNDLYPAATDLAPELDDWRDELVATWSRPVAMSGSGPSLFGFFLDRDEAEAALDSVPAGARAVRAATPVGQGWAFATVDDE